MLNADIEVVFRKDMENLWEEMLQQTRRIRADSGAVPGAGPTRPYAAAFTGAFSNVIFEPR